MPELRRRAITTNQYENEKNLLVLGLAAATAWLGGSLLVRAQSRNAVRYEYAIVRWEDPDRLYYNYPNNKFELVSLLKTGQNIPKDASSEEYCLAVACNFMAKSGWEPVNLDSQPSCSAGLRIDPKSRCAFVNSLGQNIFQ